MTVQSNPRKLYQSGTGTVVSFPQDVLAEVNLERGDRVVMTAEEGKIVLEKAEYQVVSNE